MIVLETIFKNITYFYVIYVKNLSNDILLDKFF